METCVSRSTCKKSAALDVCQVQIFPQIEALDPKLCFDQSRLCRVRSRQMQCLQSSARALGFFGLLSNEVAYLLRSVSSFKQMLLPEQSFILGCFCFETSIISSFLNWPATHEETAARQAPSSLIDLVSSTTSNNFQHKINSAILRDAVTGLPDAHPSLIVYVETIPNSVPQAFQVLSRTCFRKKKIKKY